MYAIVTLPLSSSFVLGAFLWVYPSPSSHPTFSRGEKGVMLLLYQLTGVRWPSTDLLGTLEKNKGKLMRTFPSVPTSSFLDFEGENLVSCI